MADEDLTPDAAHTRVGGTLSTSAMTIGERHYRLLAENASDVVMLADQNMIVTWVSESVLRTLGWASEQVIAHSVFEFIHPDDVTLMTAGVAKSAVTEPTTTQSRWLCADGSDRWISAILRWVDGDGNSPPSHVLGLRDIHREVQARIALERSERQFRLVMDGAPQGMAVVGLHLTFMQVNAALCAMLGRDEQWLLERTVTEMIYPDDREGDLQGRDKLLSGFRTTMVRECRWSRSDGSPLWVMHSVSLLRDEDGMPLFYVSHVQDHTDSHRVKAELAHRSSHDPLAGLANREQLHERIHGVLGRTKRSIGAPAVMCCGVDYLQRVSETYGHAVGDQVIRMIADRVASELRAGDQVARVGRDGLVVVLSEVRDVDSCRFVAEKIRAAAREPVRVGDRSITVTMSVGIALGNHGQLPPQRDASQSLLANAGVALSQARRSGRDRAEVFVSEDPAPVA
ncbi:MAG: PAS domain S-box protein [Actinomycetes bacterium]